MQTITENYWIIYLKCLLLAQFYAERMSIFNLIKCFKLKKKKLLTMRVCFKDSETASGSTRGCSLLTLPMFPCALCHDRSQWDQKKTEPMCFCCSSKDISYFPKKIGQD